MKREQQVRFLILQTKRLNSAGPVVRRPTQTKLLFVERSGLAPGKQERRQYLNPEPKACQCVEIIISILLYHWATTLNFYLKGENSREHKYLLYVLKNMCCCTCDLWVVKVKYIG